MVIDDTSDQEDKEKVQQEDIERRKRTADNREIWRKVCKKQKIVVLKGKRAFLNLNRDLQWL
jgi:hypothetical protein